METEEHLNLDQQSLKAITVPTRINILKVLSNKQQTLSDLSQLLGLSAPTLKEHLDVLEKVQMIRKLEEGRKWKYYSITDKGLGIIYPERKRIWITLALLGLSVIATAISAFKSFSSGALAKLSAQSFEQAEGAIAATSPMAAGIPRQSLSITLFIFPIITLILLIILIYYLLKPGKKDARFNTRAA